jgi:hypothetical protein
MTVTEAQLARLAAQTDALKAANERLAAANADKSEGHSERRKEAMRDTINRKLDLQRVMAEVQLALLDV